MDDQILAIYCLCDDMLKALDHQEDPQCQMSDAEVLTTALVAALHFAGNLERARQCWGLKSNGAKSYSKGFSKFTEV